MKRLLLAYLIVTFIFTCNVHAQQRTCGSTIQLREKIKQLPHYREMYRKALLRNQNNLSCPVTDDDTIKIPVVVHVLYHTAEQNISDEQIQSQIDVLNEDYAAVNATTMDVPDVWKPMIHDSKIRFHLAQRDPQGNNTTGIIRKYTDSTSFDAFANPVKYDSTGGDDNWSPSCYLNIWVCNLTSALGSILGISTFPETVFLEPEKDGITVHYAAFGRTGTLKKKYDLGRSATHEVGHWLSLTHVWGDEDACDNDDEIADTPLQAGSTFGAAQYPEFDICSPGDDGIMFMNYLDYTDDKYMMFFTPVQTDTMRDNFKQYRSAICVCNESMPAATLNHDLELVTILSPVTQSDLRCLQPIVRVRNNGMDTATSFHIVYNIIGGVKRSFAWTGTLLRDSTIDITLPSISGIDGLNVLEARITEPDSNIVNNYSSRSYKGDKENSAGCDGECGLVYPNPVTQNSFCVKSGFLTSDKLTIRVLNLLGQKLYEQADLESNPGDIFPVNFGLHPKGVYAVQLILGSETCTQKFINLPGEGAYTTRNICN